MTGGYPVTSSPYFPTIASLVNHGSAPGIYQDMDTKRGKLRFSFVYDNANNLLKSATNNYTYFLYDTIHEKKSIIFGPPPYNNYVVKEDPYILYNSAVASEAYLLTNSVAEEKSQTNIETIRKESNNIFNPVKPFLTEKQDIVNNGDILKERHYYPFDPEVSSLPNISTLNGLNMMSPVKSLTYRNNKLLSTTLISYALFNGNQLYPNQVSESIGDNSLEPKYHFYKYDDFGNLLEAQKSDDLKYSYIWGYQNQHIIAKVANAQKTDIFHTSFEDTEGNSAAGDCKTGKKSKTDGYSKSLTGLTTGQYILSYWLKSGSNWALQKNTVTVSNGSYTINLGGQVDEVRFYPEKAFMITYTYAALVGITTQCDPNDRILYYYYDTFNRLIFIRDHDKNILKKFCYNYAGQQENCTINTTPLWQSTGNYRCVLDGNSQNTGDQEREERDNNPNSATYNQTRWVYNGYNASACPPPYNCNYSNCNSLGQEFACINGQCEAGYRVNTYSYYDYSMGEWVCVYHYEYSNGSWSQDYYEYSPYPCYQS